MLAFRQNTTTGLNVLTFTLSSGYSSRSTPFTFEKGKPVEIYVYTFGTWTEEIGYQLRTYDGLLVTQRQSGTKFYANTILASVCPECLNLSPV